VVAGKNKTLYVHILKLPSQHPYIFIPELKQKVISAELFDGKSQIKFKQLPEGCFIYTDGASPGAIDTIIELRIQ